MKNIKPRGVILVLTLSLVMFLSSLLGAIIINASNMSDYIKNNLELTVFFEMEMADDDAQALSDSLATMAFVSNADFVSSKDAVFSMKDEIGDDFVEILGDNPLPASAVLSIAKNFSGENELAQINANLRQMDGVLEVTYPQNIFYQIDRNRQMLSVWISALSIVFILVAIILISSTVRLLLYSDRFIIKNQQLVGATKRFIKKPYRMKAIVWAVVSFVLGAIFLWLMLWLVYVKLDESIDLNDAMISKHLSQNSFAYLIMLFLILIANIVVVMSTVDYTIKKYLNTSTDKLYQ